MFKAFDLIRRGAIVLATATFLTAGGCQAKREATSTAESAFISNRIATSSLNDSLSLTIDIVLDSIKFTIVEPAPTQETAASKHATKAYGVRATLRSERLTDAETSTAETESGATKEASSSEVNGTVAPLGKTLLPAALIIFSAMLIFIHIKRNKSAKNSYL